MIPCTLLVRGGTLVLPEQGLVEADVAVAGEHVAAITQPGAAVAAQAVIDAGGLYVLPGVLDTHTHWGYLGDYGIQCRSDSRAAAIGGVTTALLFHRMQPGQFPELKGQGEELSTIDFVFSPTIFNEATASCMEEAIEHWGCSSFKFYLAYRRTSAPPRGDDWIEPGWTNELTDGLMMDCFARLARYRGTVACVHAENAEIIDHALARVRSSGRDGLAAWEEANPGIAEAEAIQRAGLFAEQTRLPVYFVHLGGRDALRALARVKARWPQSYGETCPHYLFHNVETSPAAVKFSPPVRHREDNEALWEALANGLLDCVGSDNASTLSEAKRGSVWDIARGGPGAGVLLPLILSEGVHKGRLSLQRAAQVTSSNAARIFGLYPRKGTIRVGSDADLSLVDLALEKTVSRDLFGTWSDYNLYTGVRLKGWPVVTLVRGRVVARDGEVQVEPGYGRYIPRQAARNSDE